MPKVVDKKYDPATTTLETAQAFLKENAKAGAICPCCRQRVQLYEREIHAASARVLIILHRYFQRETDWLHVPRYLEDLARQSGSVLRRDGDWAKLRYWGLLEDKPKAKRTDGSKRAGFWKVTEKGHQFAKGEIKLPKYALVYNDRFLGFAPGCSEVSVTECLGTEFSYDELMAGKYSESMF